MKKYVFLLIILFLLFLNLDVFAIDSCTTSEMQRLKELANNVNFIAEIDYETVENMKIEEEKFVSAFYDIKVLNPSSELKIYYEIDGYKYEVEDNFIESIEEGEIKFYIYAYTANLCVDELIMTKTVELKKLNSYYYYNKEKCQEYSDFKYCQEFYDNDLSFEEIEEEFNEYLKGNGSNSVFSTRSNYKLYIFIVSILVISIVVVLLFIKRRRSVGDL